MEQSRLRAEAAKIESEAELDRLKQARNDEIEYLEKKNKLELDKQKESTEIEINKFKQMVDSMGKCSLFLFILFCIFKFS